MDLKGYFVAKMIKDNIIILYLKSIEDPRTIGHILC